MAFIRRAAGALLGRAPAERTRPFPAEQRGVDLLLANLTVQQRRQYIRERCFDVVGGHSGRRYRIWHCFQQNIEELDAPGPRKRIWCFHPRESLVLGDVMLAQKTALELFEPSAMSLAFSYSDFAPNTGPWSQRARADFLRTMRAPWRRRLDRAGFWLHNNGRKIFRGALVCLWSFVFFAWLLNLPMLQH